MIKPIVRLSRRHKTWLSLALGGLWISGMLWLLFHYFFQVEGEFGQMPHMLEKWWLRLHGLATVLSLMVLGTLLPIHMKLAWRRNKNRRQGLLLGAVFAWLLATGYALWYFASESNQNWLPLLHWIVGMAIPLLLLAHVRAGRRRAPVVHPQVVGTSQTVPTGLERGSLLARYFPSQRQSRHYIIRRKP